MFAGSLFPSHWIAFLAASLVLAVTPGPGVLYLLTQTLRHGRRAGLASVAGVALGNLGNASAASVGLATLFAVSSLAFTTVRLAGAAYLIFLGIRALRTPTTPGETAAAGTASPARSFRDGALVALLNPKTALFFAALLPQFMAADLPPLRQSVLFGGVFVAIAACTDTVYVLSASGAAAALAARAPWRRFGKYASAASFFGLGVYAACAGSRTAR